MTSGSPTVTKKLVGPAVGSDPTDTYASLMAISLILSVLCAKALDFAGLLVLHRHWIE